MQLAPTISDETRGSSRVMFGTQGPEHLNIGNTDCEVRGVPTRDGGEFAPPAPRRTILTLVPRAAAVMDARHATSEACSPLPGRSLTDCEHGRPNAAARGLKCAGRVEGVVAWHPSAPVR
jgi:hypothetical protein